MSTIAQYELSFSRIANASPDRLFRAWTVPELLKQWWAPLPYTTCEAIIEARPGGTFNTTIEGPRGEVYENHRVFLEVVANRRLVFTDAFRQGWVPGERPFMTGHVTFEATANGMTKYTARALHWNAADKAEHQETGFGAGWSIAADQLAVLLKKML